jgi:hypothetical protein
MSDVAPAYAPAGAGRWCRSRRSGCPRPTTRRSTAGPRQLTGWYGGEVAAGRLLASYRIPYAQPRQDVADLPTLAREVRVGPRTWVCGDHRDTASIQGALVSGRRCADAKSRIGIPLDEW